LERGGPEVLAAIEDQEREDGLPVLGEEIRPACVEDALLLPRQLELEGDGALLAADLLDRLGLLREPTDRTCALALVLRRQLAELPRAAVDGGRRSLGVEEDHPRGELVEQRAERRAIGARGEERAADLGREIGQRCGRLPELVVGRDVDRIAE